MSVAREISGPEIDNILIGQSEFYTNVKFTTMSYNSLYAEMMEIFLHLGADILDQDDISKKTCLRNVPPRPSGGWVVFR